MEEIKVNRDEPRILTDSELEAITLNTLEGDRVLMRDLEKTLREANFNSRAKNAKMPPMVVKCVPEVYFKLPDDSDHIYFFSEGWPIKYDNFLRSEDIIPSGYWVQKHRSAEEIRKFAKELNMTVEEFWEEEYYCNPKVFKKIGAERAPFTKPLERVDGKGKKEQYNHCLSKWTRVQY